MNSIYSIDEHRHRFAVWAAARATSRGVRKLTVANADECLAEIGLKKLISSPEKLPSPSTIDKQHSVWRKKLIGRAKEKGVQLSHGQAAKLINVYLKSAFVCGGFHKHPRVASLHPPVDRILLRNLKKFGTKLDWNGLNWTKLESDEYQEVIDGIRSALKGVPMWEIEVHWLP